MTASMHAAMEDGRYRLTLRPKHTPATGQRFQVCVPVRGQPATGDCVRLEYGQSVLVGDAIVELFGHCATDIVDPKISVRCWASVQKINEFHYDATIESGWVKIDFDASPTIRRLACDLWPQVDIKGCFLLGDKSIQLDVPSDNGYAVCPGRNRPGASRPGTPEWARFEYVDEPAPASCYRWRMVACSEKPSSGDSYIGPEQYVIEQLDDFLLWQRQYDAPVMVDSTAFETEPLIEHVSESLGNRRVRRVEIVPGIALRFASPQYYTLWLPARMEITTNGTLLFTSETDRERAPAADPISVRWTRALAPSADDAGRGKISNLPSMYLDDITSPRETSQGYAWQLADVCWDGSTRQCPPSWIRYRLPQCPEELNWESGLQLAHGLTGPIVMVNGVWNAQAEADRRVWMADIWPETAGNGPDTKAPRIDVEVIPPTSTEEEMEIRVDFGRIRLFSPVAHFQAGRSTRADSVPVADPDQPVQPARFVFKNQTAGQGAIQLEWADQPTWTVTAAPGGPDGQADEPLLLFVPEWCAVIDRISCTRGNLAAQTTTEANQPVMVRDPGHGLRPWSIRGPVLVDFPCSDSLPLGLFHITAATRASVSNRTAVLALFPWSELRHDEGDWQIDVYHRNLVQELLEFRGVEENAAVTEEAFEQLLQNARDPHALLASFSEARGRGPVDVQNWLPRATVEPGRPKAEFHYRDANSVVPRLEITAQGTRPQVLSLTPSPSDLSVSTSPEILAYHLQAHHGAGGNWQVTLEEPDSAPDALNSFVPLLTQTDAHSAVNCDNLGVTRSLRGPVQADPDVGDIRVRSIYAGGEEYLLLDYRGPLLKPEDGDDGPLNQVYFFCQDLLLKDGAVVSSHDDIPSPLPYQGVYGFFRPANDGTGIETWPVLGGAAIYPLSCSYIKLAKRGNALEAVYFSAALPNPATIAVAPPMNSDEEEHPVLVQQAHSKLDIIVWPAAREFEVDGEVHWTFERPGESEDPERPLGGVRAGWLAKLSGNVSSADGLLTLKNPSLQAAFFGQLRYVDAALELTSFRDRLRWGFRTADYGFLISSEERLPLYENLSVNLDRQDDLEITGEISSNTCDVTVGFQGLSYKAVSQTLFADCYAMALQPAAKRDTLAAVGGALAYWTESSAPQWQLVLEHHEASAEANLRGSGLRLAGPRITTHYASSTSRATSTLSWHLCAPTSPRIEFLILSQQPCPSTLAANGFYTAHLAYEKDRLQLQGAVAVRLEGDLKPATVSTIDLVGGTFLAEPVLPRCRPDVPPEIVFPSPDQLYGIGLQSLDSRKDPRPDADAPMFVGLGPGDNPSHPISIARVSGPLDASLDRDSFVRVPAPAKDAALHLHTRGSGALLWTKLPTDISPDPGDDLTGPPPEKDCWLLSPVLELGAEPFEIRVFSAECWIRGYQPSPPGLATVNLFLMNRNAELPCLLSATAQSQDVLAEQVARLLDQTSYTGAVARRWLNDADCQFAFAGTASRPRQPANGRSDGTDGPATTIARNLLSPRLCQRLLLDEDAGYAMREARLLAAEADDFDYTCGSAPTRVLKYLRDARTPEKHDFRLRCCQVLEAPASATMQPMWMAPSPDADGPVPFTFHPRNLEIALGPDRPGTVFHHKFQAHTSADAKHPDVWRLESLDHGAVREPQRLDLPQGAAISDFKATAKLCPNINSPRLCVLDLSWKEILGEITFDPLADKVTICDDQFAFADTFVLCLTRAGGALHLVTPESTQIPVDHLSSGETWDDWLATDDAQRPAPTIKRHGSLFLLTGVQGLADEFPATVNGKKYTFKPRVFFAPTSKSSPADGILLDVLFHKSDEPLPHNLWLWRAQSSPEWERAIVPNTSFHIAWVGTSQETPVAVAVPLWQGKPQLMPVIPPTTPQIAFVAAMKPARDLARNIEYLGLERTVLMGESASKGAEAKFAIELNSDGRYTCQLLAEGQDRALLYRPEAAGERALLYLVKYYAKQGALCSATEIVPDESRSRTASRPMRGAVVPGARPPSDSA